MTRFYSANGVNYFNVDQIVSMEQHKGTVEVRMSNGDERRITLKAGETVEDLIAEMMGGG